MPLSSVPLSSVPLCEGLIDELTNGAKSNIEPSNKANTSGETENAQAQRVKPKKACLDLENIEPSEAIPLNSGHRCGSEGEEELVNLDQWWCPLAVVAAVLTFSCILNQYLGIYYLPALHAIELEPDQMEAAREQMAAATRLTAGPLCLVITSYHLYRISTFGSLSEGVWGAGIMATYLWLCQPKYHQLVRAHSLCCFVLWPMRAIATTYLIGPSVGLWPLVSQWPVIFWMPVVGALLHESIEQHLAHNMCQSCLVFAFG